VTTIPENSRRPEAGDLAARVAEVQWFHRTQLPEGIVTAGVTDPGRNVLPLIGLPERLDGCSVIDVGAWDGFFSFEAERRGAADVLATDSYCWSGEGWGTKAGFELAREAYASKVRDLDIDVMQLSPDTTGVFDVVLFLGVLYHLRNPIEAIDRVASVTGDRLFLEAEVRLDWLPSPAAVLFPDRELGGDPTNWFAFKCASAGRAPRGRGIPRGTSASADAAASPSRSDGVLPRARGCPDAPSGESEDRAARTTMT
jgi:tRNA (mo5U34)-methyltransferase